MKLSVAFMSFFILYVCILGLPQPDIFGTEKSITTIPCRVHGHRDGVNWMKDGKNLPQSPRFQQSNDPDEGIYDLIINDTQLKDTGRYECINKLQESMGSSGVLVLGLKLQEPPKLVAGTNASFICSFDPEYDIENLEIIWRFPNKANFTNSTTGSRSTANIQLSPKHNGKEISCEAHHAMLEDPIITAMKLNVEFPPSIYSLSKATDGDQLIFTCKTTSSNPAPSIKWLVNGSDLHDGQVNDTFDLVKRNHGRRLFSNLKLINSDDLKGVNVACEVIYNEKKVAEKIMKITDGNPLSANEVHQVFDTNVVVPCVNDPEAPCNTFDCDVLIYIILGVLALLSVIIIWIFLLTRAKKSFNFAPLLLP